MADLQLGTSEGRRVSDITAFRVESRLYWVTVLDALRQVASVSGNIPSFPQHQAARVLVGTQITCR